jgi:ribonucleotide reductase beta subunit family protein with ferritin-like domain
MENIHGQVYSLMLDSIVEDSVERQKLFDAIKTVPAVKEMANWALKWIKKSSCFAERLVANACIEGILFSGMFASIYWIKHYKSGMIGLISSNELISRDEGLHTETAYLLYSKLINKLSYQQVKIIIDESVNISVNFMNDALPDNLTGMNSDMMSDYIKYIADRLLVNLGYEQTYLTSNPFSFMETIGMTNKSNFFDRRPTEYQSACNTTNKRLQQFEYDVDF